MLTIFCTPKPFRGHSNIIQRNALRSWKLLDPDVEVILFGDEEGSAEVCSELGLRHEPLVERNEYGTKYMNYLFHRAQEIALHDWLCYANCDIILMRDFRRAVGRLTRWRKEFLMVGRRWDTDITAPLDFSQPEWQDRLRNLSLSIGIQIPAHNIDYFVFPRGLYKNVPPFVLGRIWWDQWLVWHARSRRIAVVDASSAVIAVHQNHDYSYHPQGRDGVWGSEESKRNLALAGWRRLNTIDDASYMLKGEAIRRTHRHWSVQAKREFERVWLGFLGATRPVRHRLGLRQDNLPRPFGSRRGP